MTRIEREKIIVSKMVRIYCRHKEGNESLCVDCEKLLNYAHQRLDMCPHGESKPTCRKCTIHCYRPDMKDKIREVMRYSGPRMLIYSPFAAITHLLKELRGS